MDVVGPPVFDDPLGEVANGAEIHVLVHVLLNELRTFGHAFSSSWRSLKRAAEKESWSIFHRWAGRTHSFCGYPERSDSASQSRLAVSAGREVPDAVPVATPRWHAMCAMGRNR